MISKLKRFLRRIWLKHETLDPETIESEPLEAEEVLMCNGCVEYRPKEELEVCSECLALTGKQYLVCAFCIETGNHTCGE